MGKMEGPKTRDTLPGAEAGDVELSGNPGMGGKKGIFNRKGLGTRQRSNSRATMKNLCRNDA